MFRPHAPGRHRRPTALALVVAMVATLAAGCSRGGDEVVPVDPLRVGAWPSLEPSLLAHTIAALLQADGIAAEVRDFTDAASARQAVELGDVDLLPGYSAAAWLEVLERSDPPGDARTSFARVREFDERNGLVWLRPRFEGGRDDLPPANATFAFQVRGIPSADASLRTMSELASRLAEDPDARLCMDDDFRQRRDGRDAVYRAYGISLDRVDVTADPADAVPAVAAGECLAGLTTTTDGAAWDAGLVPLVDDLAIFPAFVVAIVVDQGVLARQGVTTALGPFSSQLTSRLLASHNARVLAGASVEVVAAELTATLRARAGVGGALTAP